MTMKDIGELVKSRRVNLNLTQAYLAALANTGIRVIREIEQGKETIRIDKLLDILDVLNLRLEVL